MDDIITIKQLPVIEERLAALSEQIDGKVERALSLAVTDGTVKEIKKVRAEMTKEYKELEAIRLAVKKAVMAPYDEFEAVYNRYVADKFKPADATLKGRIDEVEDLRKKAKRDELAEYYAELCEATGVDFVSLESLDLNVTLSVSLKSLKEQVTDTISKIADEVAMIEEMENSAEILVEYKKCLNLPQAAATVKNRLAVIEEQKRRQEALETLKQAKAEAAKKVEAALPAPAALPPPVRVPPPAPPVDAQPAQTIVSVRLEDKGNPGFAGREYSYFTAIPLVLGEVVIVPTKKGEAKALVTSVGVSPEDVGCDLSLLKTITAKHEDDPVKTLAFKVTAPLSKLRALRDFLVEGGYEYE